MGVARDLLPLPISHVGLGMVEPRSNTSRNPQIFGATKLESDRSPPAQLNQYPKSRINKIVVQYELDINRRIVGKELRHYRGKHLVPIGHWAVYFDRALRLVF